MATLKELLDFSSQNPDSDIAKKTRRAIELGVYDEEARTNGIDISWAGRPSLEQLETKRETENRRDLIGEMLPATFGVAGGIVGGFAGTVVPGIGTVAGAITGAGAGGALGERIQQGIEQKTGLREEIDISQIVKSGIIMGATEGVFGLLGKGISVLRNMAKPNLVKLMGRFSGYADEVVKKLLERTSGAVQVMKEGETALNDLIVKANVGLQEFAKETLSKGKVIIDNLTGLSAGGKGYPGMRQTVLDEGYKFVENITKSLRETYNIGVNKANQLLFTRPSLPSRIVSGGDKGTLQEAFNSVLNLVKDTSIKNIDAVLERLMVLRSKTPVGTPTGAEVKAIIGEMMGKVRKFVDSLGNFSEAYTKYGQYLDENLPVRVFINEAKEIFGSTKNLSAKEISLISTRLHQIYNTGKLAMREGVGKIGKVVGSDVIGGIASNIARGAEEFSVRAQNLTKRGVIERIFEWIPREVVNTYVKTGNLFKLESHPIINAAAETLKTTTKIIVQDIVNFLSGKEKI